ncbi:nSTAND1 domain-containing NTPase [Streptomyces lycii]|uniref:Novel STAND NTPase 1 domain-containing protein n=1 Tax=Streptomyces lycii TaxID=2654337 RepID=A0ABQ7FHI5_9ACTN|nr:AAA family ATPase [Streptomyces lycii]KAF4408033.1 hypothetical protein GCU69_16840 [Streptomyces lycii]
MPRKELPLAEGDGTVLKFAADLRALRDASGSPPYRAMAARAHYSVATLSSAAAGRKLPSLEVTLAYVRACGGNTQWWEARWHSATTELSDSEAARTPADAPGERAPYPGLAAYQRDDSQWFFGRERVVEDLLRRLAEDRFIAVFGASGAGKSSLLRAGLLPRLRSGPRHTVVFTPGVSPLEELAVRLAEPANTTPGHLFQEFQAAPENLHRTLRRIVAGDSPQTDVVLVVDQFEEVFTLCGDRDEQRQFIAALVHAARASSSRCRIVLGVRADFYAHCAEHADLVDALRDAMVTLGPMSAEELHRAITQPAIRANCRVEGRLVVHLTAEAHQHAGVLPLLSHTLLETWKRRRGNVLTLAACQAAGSLEGALSRTAEQFYEGLGPSRQRIACQLFLRLTSPGEGTEDTKRRIDRSEAGQDADTTAVIERATAARLITVDGPRLEITHEALIRGWPRFRRWLSENRQQLRVHRQLTEAAAAWELLGEDRGALYRGARLDEARPLADGDKAGLTARERAFLEASLAAEATETAAAARRRTGRRLLTVVITVLLLATTVTSVLAARANRQLTTQRNAAVALNVSSEASRLYPTAPGLAMQLSLTAYRLRPERGSRDVLLSTLTTMWTGHNAQMYALGVSPDGRTLATGSRDRTVRLWDITDPRRPLSLATISGHDSAVVAIAMRPTGGALATADTGGTVRLWDITDPRKPRPLSSVKAHTDAVRALAFSPSGDTLVSAGNDRKAVLWKAGDLQAPERGATLRAHSDAIRSVAFNRDGRLLATAGGDDERVIVWDLESTERPAKRATWRAHTDSTFSVAFSPRADVLATSGAGPHPVKLWRVGVGDRPGELARLDGQSDAVGDVTFSADGRTLAAGSDDRTARMWTVDVPERPVLRAVLTGYSTAVLALRFTPDGRSLVSGAFDGRLRVLPTDFSRLISGACDAAGPPLSREQWARYLGGIPYKPPCG